MALKLLDDSSLGWSISQKNSLNQSFDGSSKNVNEWEVNEYLSRLEQTQTRNNIVRLSEATLPIFDEKSKCMGNSVSITSKHVLTSGHCVKGSSGFVGLDPFIVVFDGSAGKGIDKLDFKILEVDKANLKPIPLSVVPGNGDSIQIYFKVNQLSNQLCEYVKPFESQSGPYASRSDSMSVKTSAGESGAPRMSLGSGCVHAIHQGESEGLKINDIYLALENAAKNSLDPRSKIAFNILQQMDVRDLQMRYMFSSPLQLKVGAVAEEKPRIKDTAWVSIEKNNKNIRKTFSYAEVGEGKGDRWITIEVQGQQNTPVTYAISPNPHENINYNNDGQGQFYRSLATTWGEQFLLHGSFPESGKMKVLRQEYTLRKVN